MGGSCKVRGQMKLQRGVITGDTVSRKHHYRDGAGCIYHHHYGKHKVGLSGTLYARKTRIVNSLGIHSVLQCAKQAGGFSAYLLYISRHPLNRARGRVHTKLARNTQQINNVGRIRLDTVVGGSDVMYLRR